MIAPVRSSIGRRFISNTSGQVLAIVAGGIVALTGMAGLVIDVGYALAVRQALQSSTDAAASAGAIEMGLMNPIVASTAIAKARTFGMEASQKNYRANMPGVVLTGSVVCTNFVSQLMTGTNCSGGAPLNTIIVTQTAPVSTFFARVLGFNSLNVRTTSTVAMKGGGMPPLDVMVVLDATGSMGGNCSATIPGFTGSRDKMDCAKAGIKALLTAFWPCAPATGACGAVSGGNVANPIDRVGLAVFPSPKTTSLSKEFDCSNNMGSSDNLSYTSTSPPPTYIIQGLSSDYKTSAFATTLNGAVSKVVKAVYWSDGVGCTSAAYGVENPGGFGSYFADAINTAQANLVANQRTGVRKVIIFVSDGDATRPSGLPSSNHPCHLAVSAAQAATAAGTWVYSVAYEASTSGGCSDDTGITPYQTMQQIASDPGKFFSQPAAGDLISTFQKIGQSLLTSRVLDNGTT